MSLDSAVAAALASLARSEKFTSEIRELLHKKGFDTQSIDQAVERLVNRNILNDRRCANLAVARLSAKGNVGRAKIAAALEARGASKEIVEEFLPPEPQGEYLISLLRKRFPNGVEEAKAMRYLCSRGFDEDAAISAAEAFSR